MGSTLAWRLKPNMPGTMWVIILSYARTRLTTCPRFQKLNSTSVTDYSPRILVSGALPSLIRRIWSVYQLISIIAIWSTFLIPVLMGFTLDWKPLPLRTLLGKSGSTAKGRARPTISNVKLYCTLHSTLAAETAGDHNRYPDPQNFCIAGDGEL